MAKTAKTEEKIVPYVPPTIKRLEERGGGPITPASSLLHRMGKREVDDEVIAVVAWTLSHFTAKPHYNSCWDMGDAEKKCKTAAKLIERIEKELLDDLGLEWKEERMGGIVLCVKSQFIPAPAARPRLPKRLQGKDWKAEVREKADEIEVTAFFGGDRVLSWGLRKTTPKLAERMERCINEGNAFEWNAKEERWDAKLIGRYLNSQLQAMGY